MARDLSSILFPTFNVKNITIQQAELLMHKLAEKKNNDDTFRVL